MTYKTVQKELRKYASKKRAETSAWFFKTGKGQYGEGDKFIGVSNPDARKVATAHKDLDFKEVKALLDSKVHEDRFVGAEILVAKYERGDSKEKKKVFDFYLKNRGRINNWDLVDTSASYIVGDFLLDKDRSILYKLIKSKSLWDRRIAVVGAHAFIKQKDFKDIFAFTEMLLGEKEDLMHKALGWMLREVGKKDERALTSFLDIHAKALPRTTLRYAIERLAAVQKKRYMER